MLVHSYDKSTLLSVSLYVIVFIQSCLLNAYSFVSTILVVPFTFLRNLLSHCNSSVCPFGVLQYVRHVLTELVLSNNVSP